MRQERDAGSASVALRAAANAEYAGQVKKFFKTGSGHYAQNDKFLGVRVPDVRKIAGRFSMLELAELQFLLSSLINEERLLALIILVNQYEKGSAGQKEDIYRFYLNNSKYVNNWNLVDSSAPYILGKHLFVGGRDILLEFAKSEIIWERRISIVATLYFIKQNDFRATLEIAKILVNDKQDLIHKATGWMLREVGKKDEKILAGFLTKYARQMPRTMLRYAIEKFPKVQREIYLKL